MTGCERLAAEAAGELEHRIEAHIAVAAHARVRRLAGGVAGEPGVDDTGAEVGAQIDREVRQSESMRERARAAHSSRRAAAGLAVVLRVRPQLERHRDRLRALAREQQRSDRAVDAAAHRDERARRLVRERCPLAHACAERACESVRGELGGVPL